MKKYIFSSLSIILLISIVLACSKDRSILLPKDLQTPAEEAKPVEKTIKDYTFNTVDTQKIFDKLASKSETKTIKSASDLPFIAKNGTKIWIEANDLYLPNGNKITYPFDLEILELLTPKDMILHQKPTVSYGQLLTTGGELYIKATKNNQELSTRFFNNISIEMPSNNVVQGMSLFNGTVSNTGFVEWQIERESPRQGTPNVFVEKDSVGQKQKNYVIFPTQIGWINCDKFSQFQGTKTKIKFASAYPELKEIKTFLFFPDLKSVMQVYGETSGDIPVGQLVKIISIAVTKEEQIFLFTKDINVIENQVVSIELRLTTQRELDDYLQKLSF